MNVIVTGGSGFIGSVLVSALLDKGHQVTVFDHHPPRQQVGFVQLDLVGQELSADLFQGKDAIIHLAGKNIFGYWSQRVKKQIYDSRILGTRSLATSLTRLTSPPRTFISASAVGYYGDRGDEDLTELSPPGNDFLARVCIDWEKETREVDSLGVRSVQVRTAPVLGQDGLLKKVEPFYKLGLGGPLGSGNQWFPWVHLRDIVSIYVFALENEDIRGPVNACSPHLVRNKEFSRTLARVMRRPHLFKTPKWALRLMFGDLADAIMCSQKVHPAVLTKAGYTFAFPDIRKALEDIYLPERAPR